MKRMSSSRLAGTPAQNQRELEVTKKMIEMRMHGAFAIAVGIVCPKWRHLMDQEKAAQAAATASQQNENAGLGKRKRFFQWEKVSFNARTIPTHDLTCHVARLVFWAAWRDQLNTLKDPAAKKLASMNKAKKRKRRADSVVDVNSSEERTVEVISDYGTAHRVTVVQLANRLLEALPSEHISRPPLVVSDMRVALPGNTGCINIVSALLFQSAGASGFLLCPTCGHFVRGEQGLWWHQKMNHGSDHTTAKTMAQDQVSKLALIPFNGGSIVPYTPRPQSKPQSSSRAAKNQRAEQLLAPGFEAAKRGDLQALRKIVSRVQPSISKTDWDPVSSVDRIHGSTALMWAAGAGHVDVCRFLVEECGADPMARQVSRRSFGGRTALHWAARRGHLSVCQYLVESIPPLGDESRCCPVDVPTDDGTTAFCWAAWQGHIDVMKYLISKGADPNSMNRHGCNAAMWSVQGAGEVEHCEYLRGVLGCAFDKINRNGHGTVHKAAQRGKWRLAKWLLAANAVNDSEVGLCGITHNHVQKDSEGFTPSGLAAIEGFAEFSDWLKAQEERLATLYCDADHNHHTDTAGIPPRKCAKAE